MSSDSPALSLPSAGGPISGPVPRAITPAPVLGWGIGARLVAAGVCALALWGGFAYVTAGVGF
ncbi:MAG: hypothetical protein ACPGFC_06620 [Paracoccaceae bacterium]